MVFLLFNNLIKIKNYFFRNCEEYKLHHETM